MTAVNITNMRKEILNALRNADIFTTTIRGVTTDTDSFVATASQTQFQLTNTGIRNIRSLTVEGVTKKYITEYIFNPITGMVALTTGATVGDDVIIEYDYGTEGNEKIFPDFPRGDLTLQSFPRLGFEIIDMSTQPFDLGGTAYLTDPVLVQFFIAMPVNKDSAISGGIGGTDDLTTKITAVRQFIQDNAKAFTTFQFIHNSKVGPITKSTNNKIIQQSTDAFLRFIIEG